MSQASQSTEAEDRHWLDLPYWILLRVGLVAVLLITLLNALQGHLLRAILSVALGVVVTLFLWVMGGLAAVFDDDPDYGVATVLISPLAGILATLLAGSAYIATPYKYYVIGDRVLTKGIALHLPILEDTQAVVLRHVYCHKVNGRSLDSRRVESHVDLTVIAMPQNAQAYLSYAYWNGRVTLEQNTAEVTQEAFAAVVSRVKAAEVNSSKFEFLLGKEIFDRLRAPEGLAYKGCVKHSPKTFFST